MPQPFLGEIRMFAGSFAPLGWEFCAGQTVSISVYDTLFMLIGTTYGGDGVTTFNLPDLRGKLPLGQGSGPYLTPRVIGETLGSDNVTLLTPQMAAHSHVIQATNTTATTVTPGPALLPGTIPSPSHFYDAGTASPPGKNAFAPGTISPGGGTLPHNNIMPTASVNYIIAMAGIFPSQS